MKHALVLLLASPMASAQIVTVTTLRDVRDFGGQQRVADLPGPDGKVSFGEAVTATNNEPGPQTIHFAIPTSEYWLDQTIALLELEIGPFVITDDATTVDFRTQTAFAGDTNPTGWEVGIYGLEPNGWGAAAIYVLGDDCTLIGLDDVLLRGYATTVQGNRNRILSYTTDGPLHAAIQVAGVFGGPIATGNVIGGTGAGEGNVVSAGNEGIRITGPADDNVVIGNTCLGSPYGGISVVAATQYGVIARNNRIGGLAPGEGNWVAGNGRYGEEGYPDGTQISVVDADGTIVEGNLVGTTQDGMADYPVQRGPAGIAVRDSRGTVVRDNLVSGILQIGSNHYQGQRFGVAISVAGQCADTVILGNRLGTDKNGLQPIPNVEGIVVSPTTALALPLATTIGGAAPGEGNLIAFSERVGLSVHALVKGVAIRGNGIRQNGGLGIDLYSMAGGGVSMNDAGDLDDGGNHLQNFPTLQRALTTGSSVLLLGRLDSSPLDAFVLDYFASPDCDSSGYGEGAVYLGSRSVVTDAMGSVRFAATLPGQVPPGWVVTATATHAGLAETSEFSACRSVEPLRPRRAQ